MLSGARVRVLAFSVALSAGGIAGIAGCVRFHVASRLPESGFRASIDLSRFPTSGRSGERLEGQVTVANQSDRVWPAAAWNATGQVVNLAYHWRALDDTVLVNDGLRTPLPFDLGPERSVAVGARVALPDTPGRYLLEFDLVQEGVGWFAAHGSPSARVVVEVTGHGSAPARQASRRHPTKARWSVAPSSAISTNDSTPTSVTTPGWDARRERRYSSSRVRATTAQSAGPAGRRTAFAPTMEPAPTTSGPGSFGTFRVVLPAVRCGRPRTAPSRIRTPSPATTPG